jgi:hypothetical protein
VQAIRRNPWSSLQDGLLLSPKNTGAVFLNRPSLLWNDGIPAP